MLDKILEILGNNPTVSIIAVAVILIVFMYLFRDLIKKYLSKKFNLFTEEQVKDFARFYERNNMMKTSELQEDLFELWKQDNN